MGVPAELHSFCLPHAENSDPEILKAQAQSVQQAEAVQSLMERRGKVQQLINVLEQQPTETQLMQEAIAMLVNKTGNPVNLLEALQILVEPIDNANSECSPLLPYRWSSRPRYAPT
jgi:hypothetical protein